MRGANSCGVKLKQSRQDRTWCSVNIRSFKITAVHRRAGFTDDDIDDKKCPESGEDILDKHIELLVSTLRTEKQIILLGFAMARRIVKPQYFPRQYTVLEMPTFNTLRLLASTEMFWRDYCNSNKKHNKRLRNKQ